MFKKKGDFGYLKSKKIKSAVGVSIMLIVGVAIFITGLLLNKMSNRNLFTVLAVLCVLPGAKFLVAFIVTIPYKSVSRERYDTAKSKMAENCEIYTDLVITSAERVMHLDFAVVGNGQVVALMGNGKQELPYVRDYFSKGIRNWGSGYKVKVLDSEKLFLSEIANIQVKEVDEEEEHKVKLFVTSLIV